VYWTPLSSWVVLPLASYVGVVAPEIALNWFWLLKERVCVPPSLVKLVQLPTLSKLQLCVWLPCV
jgi:hypothetical protein